jgi:hypothetical protein
MDGLDIRSNADALDSTYDQAHERSMTRAISMTNKRAALFGAGRLRA